MRLKFLSLLSVLAIMTTLQALPLPENKIPITLVRLTMMGDPDGSTMGEVVIAESENDVDSQDEDETSIKVPSKSGTPAPKKPRHPAPSKPHPPGPIKPKLPPSSKSDPPAPRKPDPQAPKKPGPPAPTNPVPNNPGGVECVKKDIKGAFIEIDCSGDSWYLWAQCSDGARYGAGPFEGRYHLVANCPPSSNVVNSDVVDTVDSVDS